MKYKKFKREELGTYIVISNADNTKHIATFKDDKGKFRFVKIRTEIKEELRKERAVIFAEQNEFKRHIEHIQFTEEKLSEKLFCKSESLEDEVLVNEEVRKIIREIWNLPTPQNRRVYMYVVNGFNYAEIARIEKRDISGIKRSVDVGIGKLQKKLRNF